MSTEEALLDGLSIYVLTVKNDEKVDYPHRVLGAYSSQAVAEKAACNFLRHEAEKYRYTIYSNAPEVNSNDFTVISGAIDCLGLYKMLLNTTDDLTFIENIDIDFEKHKVYSETEVGMIQRINSTYRYYSIMRPIDIGSVPMRPKFIRFKNFESRITVDESKHTKAWGYVDYGELLDPELADDYDLKLKED